jgi:hypothetical protein
MARREFSLCSASPKQTGWVLKQEHLEMALSAIVSSAAPRVEEGDVGGVEMLVNGGKGCQKASSVSRGKPRAWQDLI